MSMSPEPPHAADDTLNDGNVGGEVISEVRRDAALLKTGAGRTEIRLGTISQKPALFIDNRDTLGFQTFDSRGDKMTHGANLGRLLCITLTGCAGFAAAFLWARGRTGMGLMTPTATDPGTRRAEDLG